MIQIDIDMPKSCFECDKTYKWKDTGKIQCPYINMPSISSNRDCRPPYCPLKEVSDNSVLEDIKAEILKWIEMDGGSYDYDSGLRRALCIIDKHTIGLERNSMIQIEDNDLPITVAQKIIKGVKPYKPAPAVKALATALTGDEHSVDTQDMFSLEEIKEIADYLMVYYQSHINGD